MLPVEPWASVLSSSLHPKAHKSCSEWQIRFYFPSKCVSQRGRCGGSWGVRVCGAGCLYFSSSVCLPPASCVVLLLSASAWRGRRMFGDPARPGQSTRGPPVPWHSRLGCHPPGNRRPDWNMFFMFGCIWRLVAACEPWRFESLPRCDVEEETLQGCCWRWRRALRRVNMFEVQTLLLSLWMRQKNHALSGLFLLCCMFVTCLLRINRRAVAASWNLPLWGCSLRALWKYFHMEGLIHLLLLLLRVKEIIIAWWRHSSPTWGKMNVLFIWKDNGGCWESLSVLL